MNPRASAKEIKSLFRPLLGQIAWSARRGYGTFISLQFGKPHLEVREPRPRKSGRSKRVNDLLARRNAGPRGQWDVWIAWAYWEIKTKNGSCKYDYEEDLKVDQVLAGIDGQKLIGVDFNNNRLSLTLKFDQGGRIKIWLPSVLDHRGDLIWMLKFNDHGYLVGCKDDGELKRDKSERYKPGTIGKIKWGKKTRGSAI